MAWHVKIMTSEKESTKTPQVFGVAYNWWPSDSRPIELLNHAYTRVSSSLLVKMARFSANITDSSEDEEEIYLEQPLVIPEKIPARPKRSPPRRSALPVSDDEESDEGSASSSSSSSEMLEDELVVPRHKIRPPTTRNALVEDEEGEFRYAHEVNDHDRRQPRKTPPPRQRGDPTIIPWAQQLGVDAQKMHVMQTSLFRMPEEAAAMKSINKPAAGTSRPKLQFPQIMNRKHSRDSEGDGIRIDPREVCHDKLCI